MHLRPLSHKACNSCLRGVDDISASSCPRCPEHRQEAVGVQVAEFLPCEVWRLLECQVLDLQAEANKWDAECKAQSQVRAREGFR